MEQLEKALLLKKEWEKINPYIYNLEENIIQKIKTDWIFHSNLLENSALTYNETNALVLFGLTAQSKSFQEQQETIAHNEIVKLIFELSKSKFEITENFIFEIYDILHSCAGKYNYYVENNSVLKKAKEIKRYKTNYNDAILPSGESFKFAAPDEVPAKMKELLSWYNEKLKSNEVNIIPLASEFYLKFLFIHPFNSGNGRIARILLNLILMQNNFPPIVMKFEEKANYILALAQSNNGSKISIIEFIAKNINDTYDYLLSCCKPDDKSKSLNLEKEIEILEKRLNTFGKNIEVTRTIDAIIEIYDVSVFDVCQQFIDACEKFDSFYYKSNLFIGNAYLPWNNNKLDAIIEGRRKINKDTDQIDLWYAFERFNKEGFGEFNYESRIIFQFNLSNYIIKSSCSNKIIVKAYNEQLTEDEINEIVNIEIRKHKDLIEKKLSEVQEMKSEF